MLGLLRVYTLVLLVLLPLLALVAAGKRAAAGKELHGRFLHLTDLHPDPFYKVKTKESTHCHGKVSRKNGLGVHPQQTAQRRSGALGLAVSDCDSPFDLINSTFKYLKQEWAGKIDFVIWTGDNARHDNDNRLPRSMKQIMGLNSYISDLFLDTFGKHVPIIPSIGNNDIYPHNVMSAGPNKMTNAFARLWKHYIPEEQYHTFQRGAYFSVEVIPDTLAVISLNTLYFYDSNKIVDGCVKKSEPGTLEMEWLEVQLKQFRRRSVQVYLTGHVPPSRSNYSPTCYDQYRGLSLQYQDTILGHHYGHMNVDHFFWIGDDLTEDKSRQTRPIDPQSSNLAEELLSTFASVPDPGAIDLAEYAVVHVNPSIVPTYYPSLRIWNYNTSWDSRYTTTGSDPSLRQESVIQTAYQLCQEFLMQTGRGFSGITTGNAMTMAGRTGFGPLKDTFKERFPKKQRHTSASSPSRTNRFLTPLGYTQMYIELGLDGAKGIDSPSQGTVRAASHPPASRLWQVEYRTDALGAQEYNLRDGTIESWIDLGRCMGRDAKKQVFRTRDMEWTELSPRTANSSGLWDVFEKRMYVNTGS